MNNDINILFRKTILFLLWLTAILIILEKIEEWYTIVTYILSFSVIPLHIAFLKLVPLILIDLIPALLAILVSIYWQKNYNSKSLLRGILFLLIVLGIYFLWFYAKPFLGENYVRSSLLN